MRRKFRDTRLQPVPPQEIGIDVRRSRDRAPNQGLQRRIAGRNTKNQQKAEEKTLERPQI